MKHLGKIVELKDGSKVYYSWDEIYDLCGYVHEDFLYDVTGECLNDLIEAIESKGEF